jgi:DNA-binding transcriptional ArsR family regulator
LRELPSECSLEDVSVPETLHGGKSAMNANTEMVYGVVCDWVWKYEYSPTVREIAEEADLSVSTVQHHLEVLIKEDLIHRGPKGTARTLTIARS